MAGLEFIYREPHAPKKNHDSLNLRNNLLKPNFQVLLLLLLVPWLAVLEAYQPLTHEKKLKLKVLIYCF